MQLRSLQAMEKCIRNAYIGKRGEYVNTEHPVI